MAVVSWQAQRNRDSIEPDAVDLGEKRWKPSTAVF